jgi:hypothetical protein
MNEMIGLMILVAINVSACAISIICSLTTLKVLGDK